MILNLPEYFKSDQLFRNLVTSTIAKSCPCYLHNQFVSLTVAAAAAALVVKLLCFFLSVYTSVTALITNETSFD